MGSWFITSQQLRLNVNNSNTKKGQHYVVFRNSQNRKFMKLEDLIFYLEENDGKVSNIENRRFRNWNEKQLRDNRVGANKIAKTEAKIWVSEMSKGTRELSRN